MSRAWNLPTRASAGAVAISWIISIHRVHFQASPTGGAFCSRGAELKAEVENKTDTEQTDANKHRDINETASGLLSDFCKKTEGTENQNVTDPSEKQCIP